MRHRVATKKMNRDTDHRRALLRNLSRSLILNGEIKTTEAKAKFVKPYVEKLVTKAKKGPTSVNLNLVNSRLRSKEALRVLFEKIAPSFEQRAGGYTRITKLGYRDGDNAPMAKLEWVGKISRSTQNKPAQKEDTNSSKEDSNADESKQVKKTDDAKVSSQKKDTAKKSTAKKTKKVTNAKKDAKKDKDE